MPDSMPVSSWLHSVLRYQQFMPTSPHIHSLIVQVVTYEESMGNDPN